MVERNFDVELSVIVPVGSRQADPATLHAEYKAGLDTLGQRYELIFVLDGPREKFAAGLRTLLDGGQRFTVISLSRSFGEATALMAGFEHASGQTIVTLPAYHQIEAAEVAKLVAGLDSADVVIGRRWPRVGGPFERMRRARSTACSAGSRGSSSTTSAAAPARWTGAYSRKSSSMATSTASWPCSPTGRASASARWRCNSPPRTASRASTSRESTRAACSTSSRCSSWCASPRSRCASSAWWVYDLCGRRAGRHLAGDRPAVLWPGTGQRPALLLASLLVVLGLQLFALGLLGELMIFTHARGLKDYQIERVIQFSAETNDRAPP
jgi:hypothetical protein